MVTIDQITELTNKPNHIAFSEYLLSVRGNELFPTYADIDLMNIAPLVSNVWVLDYRKVDTDGVFIHFSGTQTDGHFERNIMGLEVRDLYTKEVYHSYVKPYSEVHLHKKIIYSKRSAEYKDSYIHKFKIVEVVMFPCSSNQKDIDFAIGYVEFAGAELDVEQKLITI